MDVDRLRPGTVPLAPETVLWFEFLLDPNLLEKHLNKPNPDPSPTDLIIKFLSVHRKEETIVLDEDNKEVEPRVTPKVTKRTLAIKILTLKVMAFLNWDLDILESKLPLPMQVTLLHDLLHITTEEEPNVHSHSTLELNSLDYQTVFAVSLYHRWVLKSYMCGSLVTKQPRVPFIPMPGLQDPNLIAANQREEIRAQLDNQIADSIDIINKMLVEIKTLTVPLMNSFIHITEDTTEIKTKWNGGVEISTEEYKCQILYELGCFNFFREGYQTAKENFSECFKLFEFLENNDDLKSSVKFCTVEKEKLEGYCLACGILTKPEADASTIDLYEQFKISVQNQYTGIIEILKSDNVAQVIPLIERDLLEMDVQVAMCSGTSTIAKDLHLKIQILNMFRKVLTSEISNLDFAQCLRNAGDRGLEFFITSLKVLIPEINEKKLDNIKYFLFNLMLRDLELADRSSPTLALILIEDATIRSLFSEKEISDIVLKTGNSENEINKILLSASNDVPLHLISKSPRLEIMNIQQQLIQTYDTATIKNLLLKLSSKDPAKSWWRLNTKWDLPIPLQSVVMNLPKGYLQDLVYILLAKSRELSNSKDFRKSILLLETSAKEVKESSSSSSNTIYKLNRLFDWEILLVQINQYLEEYPENNIYPSQLIASCKACLAALQSGDSVIPRLEVMENCALALLNLGEWEILTTMDKRWTYLELAASIAYACQDINKHKGNKKISRDAWDLVLPVFGPSTQNKRTGGATASPTGPNLTKNCLVNFLIRLREPTCLAVVISLLARLHNVLKDEPNLEISCQYVGLWPAVVSNSNSYSSRSVAEVLAQVTLQALKFMPKHSSFLKVLGDLNYVLNDWSSALKYYLEAGAVASDFFSQPIPKTVLDDFTYRRMIKCCSQLQCHTQAAVLCQFLEEVDYTCAFKSLSETKNSHCADAMDAYYPCIWDLTILEYLIYLHNKRGENQRKQQVVKLIGLLELNSNNNEEIQREAANIRKKQFLRAMTNQYSISSSMNSFFLKT